MHYLRDISLYKEQQIVLDKIDIKKNTLIVMPTGGGKTIVTLALINKLLVSEPETFKKALVIAPTNMLVDQIVESFRRSIEYPVFRLNQVEESQPKGIFVSTGHYALLRAKVNQYNGIFFDEAHKAASVSNIYTHVLRKQKTPYSGHIFAFTASPGDKINQIKNNLTIESTVIGHSPFSWKKQDLFKSVALDSLVLDQKTKLDTYIKTNFSSILNLLKFSNFETKDIFPVFVKNRFKLTTYIKNVNAKLLGSFFRLFHTLYIRNLYLYEDWTVAKAYIQKLEKYPMFREKQPFKSLKSYENTKFKQILNLIQKKPTNSIIMIFFQNYNTLSALRSYLNEYISSDRISVLGGKTKTTLKNRKIEMRKIKSKDIDIILSTSVAQEGIDIGSADTIVFFKPVTNPIRVIQRQGRTGRHQDGVIYTLYYQNSPEQKNLEVSRKRLNSLKDKLSNLESKYDNLDSDQK
jgi:ERCC4-related helicase